MLRLRRLFPMVQQQQSIARFFGSNAKKDVKRVLPLDQTINKKPKLQSDDSPKEESDEKIDNAKLIELSKHQKPEKIVESVKEEQNNGSETTQSKLELNTSKNNGKNEGKAPTKILYSKLSEMFEQLEAEPSRLKMISIISEFYLQTLKQSPNVDNLIKIVYLSINRLGPDYEPDLELGLGETLLIKAISECYGRSSSKIKEDYKALGDLGMVAQKSRTGQPTMFKPAKLDIDSVFNNLTSIAKSTGKDSQTRKIGVINKMLTACDTKSAEAKFLIRSLEGKLRIGLAEKTVLIGLAQAFVNYESGGKTPSPEKLDQAEEILKEAFSLIPNYEIIIRNAYDHGIFNLLDHCQLTPGIPLKPMLAKPTKSISEVLDRFQGEEFSCEYKYDGERAQVHLLSNGEVRIYSRNSEDMSQRYPDLISIIKDFITVQKQSTETKPIDTMILDCEAVAWDRNVGKILPFQILSTRKRKDVEEKDIKVHICLFAFDLLYLNSESFVNKTLAERRSIMFESLKPIEGKFQFATFKNSSNLDELQTFLDQSVKDSCEGLMVKMLHTKESYYEPSKRSRNWLKLKKDYLAGVGDSLDLVVIGAYNGKGKRTGTYGGFLLASYNDDTGEYETTCKIGTGFSDEDLSSLYTKLKPTEISRPKPFYVYDSGSNAVPDVWLEPTILFEVLTADLSLSPVYKAGHQEYGKGISLRFPRFLRIRDDKGVEDATTSVQVMEFYSRQANVS